MEMFQFDATFAEPETKIFNPTPRLSGTLDLCDFLIFPLEDKSPASKLVISYGYFGNRN